MNQSLIQYFVDILPFALNENTQIDPEKLKTRDYYRLIVAKKHQQPHACPERWIKDFSMDRENWT